MYEVIGISLGKMFENKPEYFRQDIPYVKACGEDFLRNLQEGTEYTIFSFYAFG